MQKTVLGKTIRHIPSSYRVSPRETKLWRVIEKKGCQLPSAHDEIHR